MPDKINRDELMIKIGTADKFKAFLDSLCLTDLQKQIAYLKYLRGWAYADIAEELYICKRKVVSEMKVIREIIGNAKF